MAERLTFTLSGRDELSRVLGHAGDSANRLRDTMTDAADGSGRALLTLTRDANGFLRDLEGRYLDAGDAARLLAARTTHLVRPTADWGRVAEQGRAAGDALKKSLISLAPAAIPAAAALAPLAAATGAAAVAVGVYAAALGPQIAAMSEASEAEQKYQDAVEESGATSKDAATAQAAYARQLAKMPPATRQAAAQLSVLKDEYKAWSDSLAQDVMGPVTKGLATFSGLLPKLTPLVKGTSTELDRMVTILAGGMASPGLDRVIGQFTEFSTGVLQRANDALIGFVRRLDTGKVGGGISDFLDYAKAQGPLVGDVLRNLGQALANILRAGADVGVGLLQAVNAISKLIAAVPAAAITTFLQLAIAVKAVKLAALGLAAARGAIVAFGLSIAGMQAAAAAAPGRLAALSAAIGTLSRTAKLAIAGTGIGLLVIAISELANVGKRAPADLDKMTSSLGQFAKSGRLSGEAARVLGKDFAEFNESLRGLARPGQWDQIQQGFTDFFGQDSTPVKRWKSVIDDVDKSLANMVKSGNPKLAAEAFALLAQRAQEEGLTTAELNKELDNYKQALADAAFEQQLAAAAMGVFGEQAIAVKAKLDAQKLSADGLRQSINALNDANLIARGGIRGMEAAIDAVDEALKKNGSTLDNNTEKGRANNQALDTLADTTMRAAESARENGASWDTVNGIYDKGRTKLVAAAQQMGLTKAEAKKLADQILRTPDKTARLRGNMEDLQRKLDSAKTKLKNVPDSRKAAVRADIKQLEYQVQKAKEKLNSLKDKTVTVHTRYTYSDSGARREGSHGTQLKAKGGLVHGPGTGTSDSVPLWASAGEFVVRASSVSKYGVDMLRAINEGQFDKAKAAGGKAAAMPRPVGRPAASGHTVQQVNVRIDVSGAIDPVATAKAIQKQLLTLKRHSGVNINLGVG
ncbi:hypothetical protein [Streptomyces sp. V1I6]|uniref:hypothetical protein n=1 Tax=Streptomyces sp. V1I6 TaxID=3042273 RepID=UPI00278557DF|nr:hypothetical protein [Streptomyces sp. V1I6]MDQ0842396.1 polyhydroxyalkanoate synthesis regulator phasin [Streptomyces sp. V1I6]